MAVISGLEYRGLEHYVPPGTWSAERVLLALVDWQREFGRAPRCWEWSPGSARTCGKADAVGVLRWSREYPRWPGAGTVRLYFGSWSAGLEAAGLAFVRVGPWDYPLAERVRSAQAMFNEGMAVTVIARTLDVTPGTVRRYLVAGICPDCGGPVIYETSARCVLCAVRFSRRPVFSDSEIIEALCSWDRQEGMPPREDEWEPSEARWRREYPRWPSVGQVKYAYGSWSAALQAAGLDPLAHRRPWDRQSITAAVQRFIERHGRPPASSNLADPDAELPSSHTVCAQFGSLASLRIELGYPSSDRFWDREEILDALRDFGEFHGRAPSAPEWARIPGNPHVSTVERRFGSWNAGLRAAGFDLPPQVQWSKAKIISAIERHAREHGCPPRSRDWRHPDPEQQRPTSGILLRHFANWDDALRAAGLPTRERWDSQSILAALRSFAQEHGRPPLQGDLRPKRAGLPGYDGVAYCFGSLTAALQQAGVRPASEEPRWGPEQIIDALRAFHSAHGRAPFQREWAKAGADHPATVTVLRRFGSWNAALHAADLPLNEHRWQPDEILQSIGDWISQHERTPRTTDWKKPDSHAARPSLKAIERHFGSLTNAVKLTTSPGTPTSS